MIEGMLHLSSCVHDNELSHFLVVYENFCSSFLRPAIFQIFIVIRNWKKEIKLTVKQWMVLPALNKAVDFTPQINLCQRLIEGISLVYKPVCERRSCLKIFQTDFFLRKQLSENQRRSSSFLTTRKQEKTPFVFGWLGLMSLADMYSSGWFVLEFKSSVARATNWAHALCLLLPLWKYLRSVFDPRKEIIALLTTFQG